MSANLQWEHRNRGFIPPSEMRQIGGRPAPYSSPPIASPQMSSDNYANRAPFPANEPVAELPPQQAGSAAARTTQIHNRTPSSGFFSNFRNKSSNNTANPQRQTSQSQARPPNEFGVGGGRSAQTVPSRMLQQPEQPRQALASRRLSTLDGPPSGSIPNAPPAMHPEIRSVVTLSLAHAHKIYFSGPLVKRVERQPDGNRVAKDEGWVDVWAQLGGTTLSVWDMKEIEAASKQGKEVPPTYVNITDAFVQVLGSVTIPATANQPSKKYTNVLTLNTAGSNLLLFACPSTAALISWAAALRLSAWEKSRLEEIYTAHLIRMSLSEGDQWKEPRSTLIRGHIEGWVKVRLAGQTDWKRHWMVITSGNAGPSHSTNSSADLGGSALTLVDSRSHSPTAPRKNRMSGLFMRNHSPPPSAVPTKPSLALYASQKPKDRKKPLLTMREMTQAFAVYPERPELISRSTLIKLEGLMGDEDALGGMRSREAWLLMMPEVEPGKSGAMEMLRWVVAFHDAFELYGRPRAYSWDPRDPLSMMFAYPIGPHKDLLFLDRELAESLDPRDDRTSAVRSRLLNILLERMRGVVAPPTQHPGTPPTTDGPPTLPPIGGAESQALNFGNGPQQQQQQHITTQNESALPQLPPFTSFGFDSPQTVSTPPPASGPRRELSPITEQSRNMSGESKGRRSRSPGADRDPGRGQTLASQYAHLQRNDSNTVLDRNMTSSPSSAQPEFSQPSSPQAKLSRDSLPSIPGSRPDSKLSHDVTPVAAQPKTSYDGGHLDTASSPGARSGPMFSPQQQYTSLSTEPRPQLPQGPTSTARLSAISVLTSPYSPVPQSFDGRRGTPPPTRDAYASFGLPVPQKFTPPTSPPPSGAALPPPRPPPPPPPLPASNSSIAPPTSFSQVAAAAPAPAPVKPTKQDSEYTFDEAGALYYMQQNQSQASASGQPPESIPDDDESPSSSEEPTSSPAPVRDEHSPPGRQGTPHAISTLGGASHVADTNSSRLSLGRKPSGARAPAGRRLNTFESATSLEPPTDEDVDESAMPEERAGAQQIASVSTIARPREPSSAVDPNFDVNADALAALTFLEREEESAPPTRPLQPEIIEPPSRGPSLQNSDEGASQQYPSSFAPSKQAAERKAKLQAQQAAQHAAAHTPGRANGKKKAKDRGAWNDSSDEEEEEEEEDEEEDADSDDDPRAARGSRAGHSVVAHAAPAPPPAPTTRPLQPRGRDLSPADSANVHQRTSRHLPQIPGGRSPAVSDDNHAPPQRRHVSDSYAEPRRSYFDESAQFRQPSPQFRSQADFPQPGAARQTVWSSVLEPGKHPNPDANPRDTFVQLDEPGQSMTKAFTPQGLLSAGIQDKQDRSAKRQEEIARESGASLINVPNKPPPPQTGLLGAITAHERERKREGGVGAALTEREREKRLAEDRQRKLDDLQRQQLEQQQQQHQQQLVHPGSMYGGQQFQGFNPYQMMMGMNPMMSGYMGFPGMMPGYGNPQQMFAAQQAAQAYQQAMMTFSAAGSQYGGEGGAPARSPSPNQMMGGNMGGNMGLPNMAGFDPRFSMMGTPMMGMGSQMGSPMGSPMGTPPTGQGSPPLNMNMGGMGMMGMGMGNMGMGMGMQPLGMQMTGSPGFDPRFSMGPLQFNANSPSPQDAGGQAPGPHITSYDSSPAQGSSLESGPAETQEEQQRGKKHSFDQVLTY